MDQQNLLPDCWIGLDGRNLRINAGTGVTTYTTILARTISDLGHGLEIVGEGERVADTWFSLFSKTLRALSTSPRTGCELGDVGHGKRTRTFLQLFQLAQIHFRIHGKFLKLGGENLPSFMHWTYPLPIEIVGIPNIYTIHDLIPLTAPQLTQIPSGHFRRIVDHIVRRAAHVLTVSECSRQEIIKILGCPEDRITNTYLATDKKSLDFICSDSIISSLGLKSDEYFLVLGTIEARKNIRRIIAAHEASGTTTPLVIAGPPGWKADEETAEAGPTIRLLPYLQAEAVTAVLTHAKALLFPSLAEGFGLPLLEGMALGTACVTSNTGALAEIAGGAALMVNPLDTTELAAAIRALDSDHSLRARLISSGYQRAQFFSLDGFQEKIARVYNRFLPEPKTLSTSAPAKKT